MRILLTRKPKKGRDIFGYKLKENTENIEVELRDGTKTTAKYNKDTKIGKRFSTDIFTSEIIRGHNHTQKTADDFVFRMMKNGFLTEDEIKHYMHWECHFDVEMIELALENSKKKYAKFIEDVKRFISEKHNKGWGRKKIWKALLDEFDIRRYRDRWDLINAVLGRT